MSYHHQPRMGYTMYSTPFSRNSPTPQMCWVPISRRQPAPGLMDMTTDGGQGEGQSDFDNHFVIPPIATQLEGVTPNVTISGDEQGPWTHPAPATAYFVTSPNPSMAPETPPVSTMSLGVVATATAPQPELTSSCPAMPDQSTWASEPSLRPVSSPSMPEPGNHTYVSHTSVPPGWHRLRGNRQVTEFLEMSQSHHHAGGLGDRQDQRGRKVILSPLDVTYPPVAPYLTHSTPIPCELSLRENFTPRYHVLRACGQLAPIPIDLVFAPVRSVYKVNEGVFGEVYSGIFNGLSTNVFKLVPIEGLTTVNGEVQKRFDQIETEIRVSQRLNTLLKNGRNECGGFCELHRVRVLTGAYPQVLIRAWNKWNRENHSDNEVPRLGNNQLYVIFEYQHCGTDVEGYKFRNAEQSYAVLLQVAFSLAVAETQLEFEHRDLHWGNILVNPTPLSTIDYVLDGQTYKVPSAGLQTTIIDFTMARCTDEMFNPIYCDLRCDEAQFEGQNDYQFEVYRKMRHINSNDWSEFHPRSNTFWLHYLADKLLNTATYTDTRSRRHLSSLQLFVSFQNRILTYDSCTEYAKELKTYLVKPVGAGSSYRS